MPKAILHVGTMKTGTTAIQKTLANSSAALDQQGYAYLGPPMRHSSVLGPALKDAAVAGKDLIISDEGLWHFLDSKRSDTKKLATLLASYDVRVVTYLRRPDAFLNSWFLQGVKSGTGARTMTKFLASPFVQAGLSFQKKTARFQALFGASSIVLRPYEKSQLVSQDAVSDFIQTVGLDPKRMTSGARANTTEDTDRLLLRSLFQGTHARSPQLVKLFRDMDRHLDARGYQGRRYSVLTHAETTDILKTYKPVFEKLQATYGGGATPAFFNDWNLPDSNTDTSELRRIQEAFLSDNL